MELAPIALFVYNRPEHTRLTLEALSQNIFANESKLIVYCDGAKPNANKGMIESIKLAREIVKSKKWCKEVNIIEREQNFGLYKSITNGVSEILSNNNSVIVLEDDHVTGKGFVSFMNDALDKYKNAAEVACISGYIYPVKDTLPDTFFIKGADCWGWATWSRAWQIFNADAKQLLNEINISGCASDFNFFNTYPYTKMLEDKIEGRNNSWAILWYASAFLHNMLTLYPGKSLVQNIGNDGTGVHCTPTNMYDVKLSDDKLILQTIPFKENVSAKKVMAEYFKTLYPKRSIKYRIKTRIKKIIGYGN
ncbi:MAG: glycosyltransferase family 2 protein [Bacteroidetes bacterium]|nr:glycosyltransferase family 2 protein [Bacteroidota bacterium]